jgi:hypothetical protein
MEVILLSRKGKRVKKESFIHEPLSSNYPPPFKVNEPTLQNEAPQYYGHGSVYVNRKKHQEEEED